MINSSITPFFYFKSVLRILLYLILNLINEGELVETLRIGVSAFLPWDNFYSESVQAHVLLDIRFLDFIVAWVFSILLVFSVILATGRLQIHIRYLIVVFVFSDIILGPILFNLLVLLIFRRAVCSLGPSFNLARFEVNIGTLLNSSFANDMSRVVRYFVSVTLQSLLALRWCYDLLLLHILIYNNL